MSRVRSAVLAGLDALPFAAVAAVVVAVTARGGAIPLGSTAGTAVFVGVVGWLALATVSANWRRSKDHRFPLLRFTLDLLLFG